MSVHFPAIARPTASWGEWSWLHSRGWDVRFVLASSLLVSIPLLLYHGAGLSVALVNLTVAALVGGPHMYSTYTLTFLERRFWLQFPLLTAGAVLVPIAVVWMAVFDLTMLLTVFLAWASFHVLQQAAFISDCYRVRGPAESSRWPRMIDYAVIFTSMYPFALYKLIHDQFLIENRILQVPPFMKVQELVYLGWIAFGTALILFLGKTIMEARDGRLNYTKTALIGITVTLALFIPTFDQLDVAFQGINAWHSFQYLAIIWLVNKQRKERGTISNQRVARLSGSDNTLRFYLTLFAITLASGLVILGLYYGTSLTLQQCYYMVVLGSLLVHYYFDTFLFTRAGTVVRTQLASRTGVWDWP